MVAWEKVVPGYGPIRGAKMRAKGRNRDKVMESREDRRQRDRENAEWQYFKFIRATISGSFRFAASFRPRDPFLCANKIKSPSLEATTMGYPARYDEGQEREREREKKSERERGRERERDYGFER